MGIQPMTLGFHHQKASNLTRDIPHIYPICIEDVETQPIIYMYKLL